MRAPRGKKEEIFSVGDIVKELIQKIDDEHKISEDDLLKFWTEAVGEKAAQYATPVSIYRSKLKVQVTHPGWAQELYSNKRNILKKLQSRLGKTTINDIRFNNS